MEDILLLQSDPRAAAALTGALSPPLRVRPFRSLGELEKALQKGQPQGCLLDLFDSPGPNRLTSLSRLRRTYPRIALIVASDFRGREMELYDLGRIGVDGVIRMEADLSSRDLLAVVDRALAASLATQVLLSAPEGYPPLLKETIRWAIEHAETRPQVSEMAAAVAMSPRVLRKEMGTLVQLRPRNLLLWGRLLRASYLLERSGETVESVAFRLRYATGGALGKALKNHVGCGPTELVGRGGLAWAVGIFHQLCARPTPWGRERKAQPWRRR